ncbi:unnamed protein product, partial [Larinioides sclopetarius]
VIRLEQFTKEVCSVLGSIVVSIPACHAGDRGSIPRRGESIFLTFQYVNLHFNDLNICEFYSMLICWSKSP